MEYNTKILLWTIQTKKSIVWSISLSISHQCAKWYNWFIIYTIVFLHRCMWPCSNTLSHYGVCCASISIATVRCRHDGAVALRCVSFMSPCPPPRQDSQSVTYQLWAVVHRYCRRRAGAISCGMLLVNYHASHPWSRVAGKLSDEYALSHLEEDSKSRYIKKKLPNPGKANVLIKYWCVPLCHY